MSTHVVVQPVDSPEDFTQIYHCISEAFGRQIKDSIWIAMNSNWNSPEGQKEGATKLFQRWQSANKNKDGRPNTVMLKATLPDPQDNFKLKIVGAAIWTQASFVEGHGDPPTDSPAGLAALSPTERRFASQMFRSLWKRRVSLAQEKAKSESPAVFTLDTCAVDPAFQRRGVAGKLVAWGLEEAERRGGLECITEASPMGRVVYKRLGFRAEGAEEDLVYEVDEEFRNRDKPEILFMRTWAGKV
ncbi:putative GNAT family acetyltransferase [Colletotrichum karsti]|uniref:GNAT family acetyltransferase n=1 Tax=Colletotrichum karsti TaxID=1095194 RepID=A0A9P6LJX6_9PEZI|nr:putative GNAT family acetyltransferase [Colletotrichum karsti]KAF9875042.1 putative GNAT family acetyltransferase [Colletotrichum karsti]